VSVTPSHPSQSPSASLSEWEAAYQRFETPEQEIAKFQKRLRQLKASDWPRDARIVELFCGRGNGLHALQQMGFTQLEGIDLSANLASRYQGPAKMYVGDCRSLPFEDESRDTLIAQGGLHHLPDLLPDLDRVLGEVRRVLRPGGRFVAVEPWLTPFLCAVHRATRVALIRRLSAKFDALHTMIVNEQETYDRWLAHPQAIIELLDKYFRPEFRRPSFGKLMYVGIRR
jgi:SAM-dependent methyltransferase